MIESFDKTGKVSDCCFSPLIVLDNHEGPKGEFLACSECECYCDTTDDD